MEDIKTLRGKFDVQQREILTTIWRYYLKESHWMPARLLHTTNRGKKVVRPIIEQLGGSLVYEQEENNNLYYSLTFLGVLFSTDGEQVEELITEYLRLAQTLALQEPNRIHVSSQEVLTHSHLHPNLVLALGCALFLSPFFSYGSFSPTEWNAGLPNDIEDIPNNFDEYISTSIVDQYDPNVPVAVSARQSYFLNIRNKVTYLGTQLLKEINKPTDVSVNGNMDGNIIVGNGNQITISSSDNYLDKTILFEKEAKFQENLSKRNALRDFMANDFQFIGYAIAGELRNFNATSNHSFAKKLDQAIRKTVALELVFIANKELKEILAQIKYLGQLAWDSQVEENDFKKFLQCRDKLESLLIHLDENLVEKL